MGETMGIFDFRVSTFDWVIPHFSIKKPNSKINAVRKRAGLTDLAGRPASLLKPDSGLCQGPVGDGGDFFATCADLARLLIEYAGRLQSIRHLGQRNNGLDSDCQVDIGVGLLARANGIKPIFLVDPDIFRL
jgi:hypothetical protein